MRTEQLKYLLEVASCGSISAAAKRLYINQTTLSAAIQSIETELGGRLFLRTAKGVVLSPFGESAMPKIREMAKQYDALLMLEGGRAQIPAELHVCIFSCACHFWSIYLTEALRRQDMKTRLIVHEAGGNQVMSAVAEGKASIGIGGFFERRLSLLEEQAEKNSLEIEPLYMETPCIYVNKDSPLAKERVLDCGDLEDYHMALSQCCLERFYSGRFAKSISRLSVFSNLETVKDAVRRSDIFCVLPKIAMEEETEDQLVAVPMAEAEEEAFLCYLIHPQKKSMNAAEQLVVDSIKSWCENNRKA